MKKIVLPFEGRHFPEDVLEMLSQLNILSPVLLTAAFVPEVDYAQLWSLAAGAGAATYLAEVDDEDEMIRNNTARLDDWCKRHNLRYVAHTDRFDFALQAIRKESRFTDLLALSTRHFFENISSDQPNVYMKEILHMAQCPILLVPEKACLPGHIVLAYDGSVSSIHAIRQFTYLFPELCHTTATLVYLSEKKEEVFPDESFISELAAQHFKDLRIQKLEMSAENFFGEWIADKPQPWLVTGSYGRSGWSQLFAKSFAMATLKQPSIPVFIAHR
jgi:hypothetical protein